TARTARCSPSCRCCAARGRCGSACLWSRVVSRGCASSSTSGRARAGSACSTGAAGARCRCRGRRPAPGAMARPSARGRWCPPMLADARRDALVLLLVCALVFWWRLGRLGLIDPDEPLYAQPTTEMLASHDWMTPRIFGHPQFEKPILFYWLAMGSFSVLGPGELAARAPAALFGTLLVLMTYGFGARAFGRRSGL